MQCLVRKALIQLEYRVFLRDQYIGGVEVDCTFESLFGQIDIAFITRNLSSQGEKDSGFFRGDFPGLLNEGAELGEVLGNGGTEGPNLPHINPPETVVCR